MKNRIFARVGGSFAQAGQVLLIWIVAITESACTTSAQPQELIQFDDVAAAAGLNFTHHSPFTEQRHVHLTMGSGVGWLDYDRDDWPDVYFGQGSGWQTSANSAETSPPSDRFFRNRQGRFEDVTRLAGIANTEYAMGIAVGDADNDGFPDIYVTNFGPNRFFRNNGDGTFAEISHATRTDHPGYGASCTWSDIDADGCLDLYVSNYLSIDPANYTLCTETGRGQTLHIPCPPWKYPGEPDVLYRGLGDGTFEDVSRQSGIAQATPRPALGVVTGDIDRDGDLDFYVANDSTVNHLWLNDGTGRFTESGLNSGTALNRNGQAEAGMGLALGDVDADARLDLFVTNYHGETNTLYRNEGLGLFLDVTNELGLAAPSRTRLGFGTLLADFDHDAHPDLFVANGHLSDRLETLGLNIPYRQKSQLFKNDKGRRFVDVSNSVGGYFRRPVLGRGCAAADFDRDGLLDVAVQHLGEPAALLRNTSQSHASALPLELVGTSSNRDAIGAIVELVWDSETIVRQRDGSTSYLSCSESRMLIGIGDRKTVPVLRVHWPGGSVESWSDLPAGAVVRLIEGQGDKHAAVPSSTSKSKERDE